MALSLCGVSLTFPLFSLDSDMIFLFDYFLFLTSTNSLEFACVMSPTLANKMPVNLEFLDNY